MNPARPPLVAVADPAGSADPWARVWIAEDVQAILNGVQSGSWIDTSLGGVSAGLDALALVSDPIGSLLQYGVAWMIEHVRPLTEALDWLAGDPAQIAAHAQTWRNIAGALREHAADLQSAVRRDTAEWVGSAADAYRIWAGQQRDAVGALAVAAETMSAITEGAGTLVAGVRMMVRDAIAVLVSRLISYAGELVFSLGTAAPLVVEQVSTLCAAWAARIARWLRALIRSLAQLRVLAERMSGAIEAIKKLLTRLRGRGGGGPTMPSGKPDPGRKPRGPRTAAHPTKLQARSFRRENESADLLARNGFDVEQNPPTNARGKNPDYRIEGEYFDCYAPDSERLETIRTRLSAKVAVGSAEEVADVLRRKPIADLKELLVIEHGRVTRLFPFES